MNGKYLLDTNIVIALFAEETVVVNNVETVDRVFVPSTVLGELYYGAQRSGRAIQNLQQIDNFRDANTILACDETTASIYGVLKNMLRSKGRPLPENDIWIAAVAIQHGLTLVSRDAHFDELETLQRVTW